MRSSAWMGFVGLVVAVVAATTATAGRAEEPFCCNIPCRLLDPLGQDPVWTGRADALLLWRNAPQGLPLFQYTTPDFGYGDVAMNASSFQSGMASGPRFALFRHTGDMGAIEFNYLRVQSFTASQTLPFLENGYYDTEQGLYCCTTEDTRDGATGLLSSSLQSAEVNRRFPTDGRLGWLMGFRWVEWNDALGLASVTSYPSAYSNSYLTRASNDLYGMQVGADSILYGLGRPFRVEGIGKAGIFYNDARQSSRFSTTAGNGNGQTLAVSTAVGRAAFVGEVGVTAVYDVTDRISLRGGYAIFWLGGLALAPAQYGVNTLCPGNPIRGATDTSGSVVVQGLSLGLEARW